MRILTVNIPESYLRIIDSMCGEHEMFPSRSELVRAAVSEFLVKELSTAQNFMALNPKCSVPSLPTLETNKTVIESELEQKISEMNFQSDPDPVKTAAIIPLPVSQPIIQNQHVTIEGKTFKIIQR